MIINAQQAMQLGQQTPSVMNPQQVQRQQRKRLRNEQATYVNLLCP